MNRGDEEIWQSMRTLLSARIRESNCTLDEIQKRTGINRSKLGRIRLGRNDVSVHEALLILRALGRPACVEMLLLTLGKPFSLSHEGMIFLDGFLENMPMLFERLNPLGSSLNPRWARGSILHLADAITRQAERVREADVFLVGAGPPTSRS